MVSFVVIQLILGLIYVSKHLFSEFYPQHNLGHLWESDFLGGEGTLVATS